MNLYLIGYIIFVVLLLGVILMAPHNSTSLDPEKPSVWDFPGWYFLIMLLVIIGFWIHKFTS